MAYLKDVIYYLLSKYPNKKDLCNARVTKMVYLADWHSCVKNEHPLTSIKWFFNNYGPFVRDVECSIMFSPELFSSENKPNPFGFPKTVFSIKDDSYQPNLSEEDVSVLDKVIEVTKDKNWDQFITFVYSTYPIIRRDRYSELDLVELAKEYKRLSR